MKMKKIRFTTFVLLAGISLIGAPVLAADLNAPKTDKAPKIDGKVDGEWSGAQAATIQVLGGKPGNLNVTMKAMYDKEFIYLLVQWPDKTMSQNRVYEMKGGKWKKRKGNEDRLGIMFNIGDSIAKFNQSGCQAACHKGESMATEKAGEKGDMWHWKAQRSNPVGYADDQYVQHKIKKSGDEKTARKSDKRSGGSYKGNFDKKKKQPKFIGVGMGGPVLLKADAKAYKGGAKEGTVAPREVLARPIGSRGDIDAKAVHANGMWTLEMRRKLNTGNPDDVVFVPGKRHAFGVAVYDNGGGLAHSFSVSASQLILK